MEKIVNILFYSSDYSDSHEVEKVKINFSDFDIEKIQLAQKLIKENGFESISIEINSGIELLDGEDQEYDNWEFDYICFKIYYNSVYFYAQNKYHSGDQIESDCILIDDLLNK
jgi:hypothetical protein